MIFSVFPKCDGLTPAQTLSAGLCFRTLKSAIQTLDFEMSRIYTFRSHWETGSYVHITNDTGLETSQIIRTRMTAHKKNVFFLVTTSTLSKKWSKSENFEKYYSLLLKRSLKTPKMEQLESRPISGK